MRRTLKIVTLLYAAFYVLVAHALRQDNLKLDYPDALVFFSFLAHSIIVVDIVLPTFEDLDARLRSLWRWLFPLLIGGAVGRHLNGRNDPW